MPCRHQPSAGRVCFAGRHRHRNQGAGSGFGPIELALIRCEMEESWLTCIGVDKLRHPRLLGVRYENVVMLAAAAVTTEPAGGLPQPSGPFALLGMMN